MKKLLVAMLCMIMLLVAGCQVSVDQNQNQGPSSTKDDPNTLVILSSSENKFLEDSMVEFGKKNGFTVKMVYKGSVDGMSELTTPNQPYDAVFQSNTIWIGMGDKNKSVKSSKSIMTSPVVIGIKKSEAQKFGFVDKDVYVKDILNAIENNGLKFAMTSASQSNSGASFYLGAVSAVLNNPTEITLDDLSKPEVKAQVTKLLSAVDRSSGSSAWLGDLFLTKDYNAMVNYESVILEVNQKLVTQGKEPLQLIYPIDGMAIADYPFAYYDRKQSKLDQFTKLQDYLLSREVQDLILNSGRRTAQSLFTGNLPTSTFKPEWGVDPNRVLTPINFPATDVVFEALNLYQTEYKRPLLTYYVLDFSGSMSGNGEKQLKNAMKTILDQEEAKKNLLQSSSLDKFVVIPFSGTDSTYTTWEADGKSLDGLLTNVLDRRVGGGTDIYSPMIWALNKVTPADMEKYRVSIVLMTDGESDTGKKNVFEKAYSEIGRDIPVFSITFGDANPSQLNRISDLTHGRTFDGTKNLVGTFKEVRGYN